MSAADRAVLAAIATRLESDAPIPPSVRAHMAEQLRLVANAHDPLAEALTEAAVQVAHVAAELEQDANRGPCGDWVVDVDTFHQLRAVLGVWSRAGEAFLASVGQKAAGT